MNIKIVNHDIEKVLIINSFFLKLLKEMFKKSNFCSLTKFYTVFINPIIIFLLNFGKKKKKMLLEHSFFSVHYYNKIFPKYLFYIKNFKNQFYINSPFYFSEDKMLNALSKKLRHEFKDYVNSVLFKADLVLQNKYIIFNKEHQFRNQINWFYSFNGHFTWPFNRAKKINYILNYNHDIDVKYALRLNYHQEFITLGLAFYLTNDEKYALKYVDLILNWIKRNPPNFGINWIDPLEISHRIIFWIFALSLFKNSKSLTKKDFNLIATSLFQQVFFVRISSNKYSYNHVIGEYFSVYLFSKIFKNIRLFNKWYRHSKKILIKQIARQIQRDGVHIEQSTHYHRMVLEVFSLLLIIEPKMIPANHIRSIEKMFEFIKYIIMPNGDILNIGDSDDAHFIPTIFFKSYNSFNQELLHLGATLFTRNDFKLKYLDIDSVLVLILLGIDKYEEYKSLKFSHSKNSFKYFEKSGYLVIKSDWSSKANLLFFDMAQFSPKPSSHDHSDITNIIFLFRGVPIIIDSGTYMYNINQKKRNKYRSSKAHNVVSINYRNQAYIEGIWEWSKIPSIKREFKCKNNEIEGVVVHNGYKNFIIKRRLKASLFLDKFQIIDNIIPNCNYYEKKIEISSFFHFPKEISLKLFTNKICINSNLFLEFKNKGCEIKVNKDIYSFSPFYGEKIDGYLVEFKSIHDFSDRKEIEIIYNLFSI